MKKLKFSWTFIGALLFSICSCNKSDDISNFDTSLCQYISQEDEAFIKEQMNVVTTSMSPSPTSDDDIGHKENLDDLIELLNQVDCIEASKICYACIYTLPAQSEIKVKVDYDGQSIERIFDISTPQNAPLKYLRMHE